jgi:Phage integrase family
VERHALGDPPLDAHPGVRLGAARAPLLQDRSPAVGGQRHVLARAERREPVRRPRRCGRFGGVRRLPRPAAADDGHAAQPGTDRQAKRRVRQFGGLRGTLDRGELVAGIGIERLVPLLPHIADVGEGDRLRRRDDDAVVIGALGGAAAGAFLDAVADDRLYALWHLITFRGLRRGEACGLRWADTDLDRGVISIQAQLVQIGWTVRESTPKSEASDAKVALDATTVAVLKSWRKAQVAERLAWGEAWTDTGRVFTREDGKLLHPSFVTVRFQRLAFDAGLPPIREHDLRHGAASLARKGGVDMKGIQAMLRHSSQAITADTYTSIFDEESREVAEAVASVVPRKVAVREASETDVPRSFPAGNPMGLRSIT